MRTRAGIYTPRPTGYTVFINPRALSNVLATLGRYSPGPSGL